MSDPTSIPEVELSGSLIRVSQISMHQERSVVTISVDAVDEFCESLYWARKQHLTGLNDASRVAEGQFTDFVQASDDLKSKSIAQ